MVTRFGEFGAPGFLELAFPGTGLVGVGLDFPGERPAAFFVGGLLESELLDLELFDSHSQFEDESFFAGLAVILL